MALQQQIEADMRVAQKARDTIKLDTLRGLLSAIKYKAIDAENRQLAESAIYGVINSQVKQHRDSIEQFSAGGRQDLAGKETAELNILLSYLPAPLSADEVLSLINAAIEEAKAAGPRDMGKVMKILAPQVAGRADGKLVSEKVKERLSAR